MQNKAKTGGVDLHSAPTFHINERWNTAVNTLTF